MCSCSTQVNGVQLFGKSRREAITFLKEVPPPFTLVCCRRLFDDGTESLVDEPPVALSPPEQKVGSSCHPLVQKDSKLCGKVHFWVCMGWSWETSFSWEDKVGKSPSCFADCTSHSSSLHLVGEWELWITLNHVLATISSLCIPSSSYTTYCSSATEGATHLFRNVDLASHCRKCVVLCEVFSLKKQSHSTKKVPRSQHCSLVFLKSHNMQLQLLWIQDLFSSPK